ncbi:MAG: hypothetical protein ABSC08_02780 [Bryobacteraceae bacterium]|jgi:hypothetical protein
MFKKALLITAALGFAALLFPQFSSAQPYGRHPRYLHARTDLRTAQFILRDMHMEPNVVHHLRTADAEIEHAIREIDRAAVLDNRNLNEHPHIDTHLDRSGRFKQVMRLLNAARGDIAREEDNPNAIRWRDVAYRHIDIAMEEMRRAAHTLHMDHMEGY